MRSTSYSGYLFRPYVDKNSTYYSTKRTLRRMKKHSHLPFAIVFFSVASLLGCASSPATQTTHHSKQAVTDEPADKSSVKTRLNKHFQLWRGTPYKIAGLNKRGIDCSGFVYMTYRDVFGKKIPRTTALQVGAGREITQQQLTIGDLVFFKTGRKQRHVGIYIGQGQFIHASTSRGVITSRLSSDYWAMHYWKSIRMR